MKLDHWIEWKKKCAIRKCSDETAEELAGPVKGFFKKYLYLYDSSLTSPDQGLSTKSGKESICWHYLESHAVHTKHGSGKAYKDWLFEYAKTQNTTERQLRSLMAGVKTLTRTIVRNYCAKQYQQTRKDQKAGLISKDNPSTKSESSEILNVLDYEVMDKAKQGYASALTETEKNEFCKIAGDLASLIVKDMTNREKIVTLARCCGFKTLDDPKVLAIAGCKKSSLFNSVKQYDERVSERLKLEFNKEDPETVGMLRLFLTASIQDELFEWGKLENSCKPLLKHLEQIEEEM